MYTLSSVRDAGRIWTAHDQEVSRHSGRGASDSYVLAAPSPRGTLAVNMRAFLLWPWDRLFGPSLPARPSPEEAAAELISYTLANGVDGKWLSALITDGRELGDVEELNCVYTGEAMEDLLGHPERYASLTAFLDAMGAREDDIVACLTLLQKFKYGPRLDSFSGRLYEKSDFFNGFTELFGRLSGGSTGQAAVELTSYFFRQDRLDEYPLAVLDEFRSRLNAMAPQELRRRRSWS